MKQLSIDAFNWICDNAGVIFSGIGVLVITLIMNWLSSRKKQKQEAKEKEEAAQKTIKALELKETELRLQAMPELWVNGTLINKIERLIRFDLNNSGDTAKLISITVLTGNLRQHGSPFPYSLSKGQMLYLNFIYTGKGDINNDKFTIELYFKDKLNNSYKSLISGKGAFQIESTDFIGG